MFAGEIGLRHAVAIGNHRLGDALEAEIGDAEARGRNGEHDQEAEHHLGAQSEGRKPGESPLQAQARISPGARFPLHQSTAQWIKAGKFVSAPDVAASAARLGAKGERGPASQ